MLRRNGGPTPTHALLEGSIAIDRGNAFGSSVDQRDCGGRATSRESPTPKAATVRLRRLRAAGAAAGTRPGARHHGRERSPASRHRIVKGPARDSYETKAKFRFASTEAQSSFHCKVDKSRWRGCRNPYKRTVKPGKHVFKVRAIDRFGNVDPTPARSAGELRLARLDRRKPGRQGAMAD